MGHAFHSLNMLYFIMVTNSKFKGIGWACARGLSGKGGCGLGGVGSEAFGKRPNEPKVKRVTMDVPLMSKNTCKWPISSDTGETINCVTRACLVMYIYTPRADVKRIQLRVKHYQLHKWIRLNRYDIDSLPYLKSPLSKYKTIGKLW